MTDPSDITTAAIGAWRRHRGNDLITDGMLAIFEDAIRTEQERCLDCQPSTAENPNEDAYQRGRFDGIMEFARLIRGEV